MKLATRNNGAPDGRLLVISSDLARGADADAAATLQDALDRWDEVAPRLRKQADALDDDVARGLALDQATLMAAMPRSYQFLDASAFLAHNHILADAWGYERRTPADPPLMYQGLSDRFLPPQGAVSFGSADDEIDFEAEYGVLTDRVPRGVSAADALGHVKLLVMVNDWSLRAYGPAEMKAGFGFLHAKPPSSLSAIAITPDELGTDWSEGRLCLPMTILRNGKLFGEPDGREMTYGFDELIAHAAATRELCAGTVIGSGTVSNADAAQTGSGCIAERRALDKLAGRQQLTAFLGSGDSVSLEVVVKGSSPFGRMSHSIVIADAD